MNHEELTLKVNGTTRTGLFPKGARLLDALRRLGYSGTKEGCGEGECGACTVLLGGRPVNSCVVFAKQAVGKPIVTIEGIGAGHPGELHPFQQAMVNAAGVQCGFCTPGIVVTGAHHLDTGGSTGDADMRTALSGNLCRCTGYSKILQALHHAGENRGGRR
ncbi:MAG: (2Fe-2S)-binding protein [Myxococcaceae bacterium]